MTTRPSVGLPELGRLEDLPQDYRDQLRQQNLVPLWPSLRAVLPPEVPTRRTRTICWPYAGLRPLLLRAGELTPMSKAERRVLVLANPGHGLEKMQASAAMYLGMQLLLPGERAPSHRHTPNAVRLVVEGEGAWTTVDGRKLPMHRGDLILTPTGLWHAHGHEGEHPVVWLDVLDLPLMHYIETSYVVEGAPQQLVPDRGASTYGRGGLAPCVHFERTDPLYPLLRYPWVEAKAGLQALADTQPDLDAIQIQYIHPTTGSPAQNVLGFYALMLRPGETLRLPARSPACVFHLIEGSAELRVDDQHIAMAEADTSCVPGFTAVTLANTFPDRASFFFLADETPLHQKLGVYERRG